MKITNFEARTKRYGYEKEIYVVLNEPAPVFNAFLW